MKTSPKTTENSNELKIQSNLPPAHNIPVEDPLNIEFEDLLDPKINLESYKMFILMYLFNAIFIIPIFILKMIFEFISQFRYCVVNCELIMLIKFIFCYWLDILVACSVLIMYPLAIIHCHKNAPINF